MWAVTKAKVCSSCDIELKDRNEKQLWASLAINMENIFVSRA